MRQRSLTGTQPAHPDSAAHVRLPHVLVVDDDPTNRRVLRGMLEVLGYACTVVQDGEQAVLAVEQGQFDAVLMDCLMPVMDGYNATRAIRRDEAGRAQAGVGHLPVIAVTALAMQGARDRCLEAGMDDYLTKPVMLESLRDVLGRWIVGRQAADAWNSKPEAPVQAADDPIDRSMLDELRALGDEAGPALVSELVHNFGTEIPARFPLMRAAVAADDTSALLHELHFVAGCAAIVGARRVEQIARSVNVKNTLASAAEAGILVSRLEAAFTTAHALLTTMAGAPKT